VFDLILIAMIDKTPGKTLQNMRALLNLT